MKAPEVRLYLQERREHGFYHLDVSVVVVEEGEKIRNHETVPGFYVEGLLVTCQGSDADYKGDTTKREVYAWEVEFRPAYVNLERAHRILKTLRAIEGNTRRLAEKFGRPVTYGQYCGRVALALGVAGFVVRTSKPRSGWDSYDDHSHRFMSIADGIGHIDWMVAAWVESGRLEPRVEVAS